MKNLTLKKKNLALEIVIARLTSSSLFAYWEHEKNPSIRTFISLNQGFN
jgi:hypothetical protein